MTTDQLIAAVAKLPELQAAAQAVDGTGGEEPVGAGRLVAILIDALATELTDQLDEIADCAADKLAELDPEEEDTEAVREALEALVAVIGTMQ